MLLPPPKVAKISSNLDRREIKVKTLNNSNDPSQQKCPWRHLGSLIKILSPEKV